MNLYSEGVQDSSISKKGTEQERVVKVNRFDFDGFWNQIPAPSKSIECLGFDYEHRNGFVSAYFLFSPLEISEYVEEVEELSKHMHSYDLDLDSKDWRLNYDEEELDGLSGSEARMKYVNDEIERIIFDYTQYPPLPRLGLDDLVLFYDENENDLRAGFERWCGTYTDPGSKPIRLAHSYYSVGKGNQGAIDHRLYKSFVSSYAIRKWLNMYDWILSFNRNLSKSDHESSSLASVNKMPLEQIMAVEPFVYTLPSEQSLKKEVSSQQLLLPIKHEPSEFILVRDASGSVHFEKR